MGNALLPVGITEKSGPSALLFAIIHELIISCGECGYHVTIYRSNLEEIPEIDGWALKNIHKVQHISFIAYRAIPCDSSLQFYANGKKVETSELSLLETDNYQITISTEEMYSKMNEVYPELRPATYLNGTSDYESNKFLITVNIGSRGRRYGMMAHKGKLINPCRLDEYRKYGDALHIVKADA